MKNKKHIPNPDPPISHKSKKRDHAYVGALNIFVNKKGQILLMKRSKQSVVYPNTWGLIGGYLEMGETGAEGAEREAEEEIGVKVKAERFTGRFYDTSHPYHMIVISLPFYSKIISGKPYPAQPEECSEVKWFDPKEVRRMELAYDHKDILKDENLI
jgi:mutator protein MutT